MLTAKANAVVRGRISNDRNYLTLPGHIRKTTSPAPNSNPVPWVRRILMLESERPDPPFDMKSLNFMPSSKNGNNGDSEQSPMP